MPEALRSILLGTAGLSLAAAAAAFLTLTRGGVNAAEPQLRVALRLAVVAVLAQAAHFAEEAGTGFDQRFPEILGLTGWSSAFFLLFNLFWLAAWALSIWGLSARWRPALFPLWFLAIAGVANGLAHPLLSIRTGGYFPGLFTSPLVGVAGVLLFRSLLVVTGRVGSEAYRPDEPVPLTRT